MTIYEFSRATILFVDTAAPESVFELYSGMQNAALIHKAMC